MNDVRLIGAETVDQAARNIVGAAEQMARAAQQFEDATLRLSAMLDEKLAALEQLLDAHAHRITP